MVTPARTREVAQFLAAARDWSTRRPDILATALVGSWASDRARMDSDVDLVIVCSDPADYLDDYYWSEDFGYLEHVVTRNWGGLEEVRFRRESGLEIEFGFVELEWAEVQPIDPGTLDVVLDAIQVLHDPRAILAGLIREARRQQ
jgi:predicted nucleotidyltransferase